VTGDAPDPGWGSATRAVAGALIGRPWLWPVALVTVLRLARRGWWHRWPPLPLPARRYWGFRLATAYGTADTPGAFGDRAALSREDVVAYLRWCRRVNALSR
jgi:hypothetical protein